MMNRDNQRPVTLEDLLRLKRTERPPAEFWTQFDRELRAKQLAAIVEKRPWWRRLPTAFAGFSRYHLPLGATAALALTVFSVREYRHAAPPAASGSAPEAVAIVVAPAATETTSAAAASLAAVRDEGAATKMVSQTAAPVSISPVKSPSHVAQAAVAPTRAENSEQEMTPIARFIATNLALAKATDPGVAQNLLGASHGFESRAVPTRTPAVEPLAQMTSPADARRSRLLGGSVMAVTMNTVLPARTVEVRSRRLSDGQLYDSISRFGASGSSLLVKF